MPRTVAEVMVDALAAAGARRCYGIVGDTLNAFAAALSRSSIEWVHVRHEEVGAFAAGGEAYLTRELALCAGSAGPGSLHFINGIFESHRNGAPVVLIASQIDRREQGFDFPQEVDLRALYAHCSVYCETLAHPEHTRRLVTAAAQAALVRGGVAVIVVSGDMLKETCADELAWSVHRPVPIVRPGDAELQAVAAALREAKRITIYGGLGCRFAHDAVVALAAKLNAPVAHTSRAKEFLGYGNPHDVGMTGILGERAGFEAVSECDLLLCLGTDFAYTQFYPDGARIVQIDIAAEHLGRRSPVHLGVVGDVGATVAALLPLVEQRTDSTFLQSLLERRTQYTQDNRHKRPAATDPIHPQFVAAMLDRLAAADAAFTADGGSPMVWLLRHVQANGRRSFLLSLLHGTMANAYPQALGIAKAYPGRQVVALCGDGGLSMLMGDLLTLVQEHIPIKLLVFDNSSLGFVEMEQKVEGQLDVYTGLVNPDFAKVAVACGLHGRSVVDGSDLEAAMREWLSCEGPALLAVKVNRMELVRPPKIELSQVASTALYGIKAVLNGRGDDVYQLLKSNFWR